jgi:hypothetical protein
LKKKIFNNSNHSFEGINDEVSKKLTKIWEAFENYFKNSNVQCIEMHKEKLYTIKENKLEILENNLEKYYEVIIQSLIRKKINKNKDDTKESKIEIDKIVKIELNENFDNLSNIISEDNKNLKLNEEPYIDKIKLEQIKERPKNLNQKEFEEITKNLGSILYVKNPAKNDNITEFMKTFRIPKERIN